MEGEISSPLLLEKRTQIHGGGSGGEEQKGGSSATTMVVLGTLVAVSRSYVFGLAYSLFGSILTIGAMIGAIMSGRIADYIDRRGAKIGRGRECEVALQRLRGHNADISNEAAEIRDYTETILQLSEASIFELFQWKYAHSLIVSFL
ncbi:hypothetical protein POTOM_045049 [Populus tomentosa]|uniref:Uncharacterized protein n=1 Tax=Populus tomentosa TaxID=118781 RepID=A0A8X7YD21_POPTO|nr:hypothetical protein POTOM_045049 [Populus tomentosa]